MSFVSVKPLTELRGKVVMSQIFPFFRTLVLSGSAGAMSHDCVLHNSTLLLY